MRDSMAAADSSASVPLPGIGEVFASRYRLDAKLATGGMGTVYRATDSATGQLVAVKVLHPELSADAEVRRRFRRESSILAALDHPSIVRVLDVGTDAKDRCFTAMELLSGETLRERMERSGPMAPKSLVAIVEDICSALSAVHAHGVVHGDIKPENVFVTSTGEEVVGAKLVDFGSSKVHGLERLTRTGEIIGTPRYMAPELLTGDGEPDGRVDTYATGVILYEALSGQCPFTERNPGKLLMDVVLGRVTPLEELRPDLGAVVYAVVERAMARVRNERFPAAKVLAAAYANAAETQRRR
jgi:serine/threonine-protein kinase